MCDGPGIGGVFSLNGKTDAVPALCSFQACCSLNLRREDSRGRLRMGDKRAHS
jgi:hypothetical protein